MPSQPNSSYLIKGDISGIQDFIFNVKSSLAAQSLKGRSFFLKLLLEVGMQMVFDTLGIKDDKKKNAVKISTSGGNFILKLDDIEDPTVKINSIQANVTKALQFTGLNMMIVCVEMKESYIETQIALNQKIRERKYGLLVGDYSQFEPFSREEIAILTDKEEIIERNKWVNVTDKLKKSSNFSIKRKEELPDDTKLIVFGDRIQIAGYEISFGTVGIPMKNYLESLFPKRENGSVTFEFLAQDREVSGIQKLGVLAMDVDNLGSTLEKVNSPQSHRQFDQRLQEFFNNKLRQTLNQSEFKNRVYVVTAGGDDSYFVGKWNILLDLAINIKRAFLADFKEPELSISAALVIVDPNFPVVRFAQMAEDAIKDAKYQFPEYKGNINLFGEVIDWSLLEKEISKLRSTFNDSRRDLITSGLLTKARQTSLKIAEGEGMQLSDFWKLGYYMRNFQNQGSEILRQYRQYLSDATTEQNPVKKRTYKLIFPVAARLSEFDNRKN